MRVKVGDIDKEDLPRRRTQLRAFFDQIGHLLQLRGKAASKAAKGARNRTGNTTHQRIEGGRQSQCIDILGAIAGRKQRIGCRTGKRGERGGVSPPGCRVVKAADVERTNGLRHGNRAVVLPLR